MDIRIFIRKIISVEQKKRLKHFVKSIMIKLCPATLTKIYYKDKMHKPLNLKNPKDLNEKIQWLKLYSDTSMWPVLADKYRMRQYVADHKLGHMLTKLYGVWERTEDIDFNSLPEKFVIKLNNGCGDAIIVKDKSKIDERAIQKKMRIALKKRFGVDSCEPHYLKIPPRIIAEELLEDPSVSSFSRSLVDYKLWCFDGVPFGFLR